VLSSDFEAFEVREGNKQHIDVQREFYRGFEECKLFMFLAPVFAENKIFVYKIYSILKTKTENVLCDFYN